MHTRIALAVLLLAASACEPGGSASDPQPDLGLRVSVVRAESLAVIQQSYYSAFRDPMRQVISDQATWEAVWAQANGTVEPQPPLPEVNFGSESVLLVAMGGRSSGGYGIGIDSVAVFEEGQRVYVTSSSPGSNCMVTAVLTSPAQLVKVPRNLDTVTFDEQSRTYSCDPR